MFGNRFSGGMGTVFVVTISSISWIAPNRSMAGGKSPCVQASVTRRTPHSRRMGISPAMEPPWRSSSKMVTSLPQMSPMIRHGADSSDALLVPAATLIRAGSFVARLALPISGDRIRCWRDRPPKCWTNTCCAVVVGGHGEKPWTCGECSVMVTWPAPRWR